MAKCSNTAETFPPTDKAAPPGRNPEMLLEENASHVVPDDVSLPLKEQAHRSEVSVDPLLQTEAHVSSVACGG